MIDKEYNVIEAIKLIDSTLKDICKFVEMKSKSISSDLNKFNHKYRVVTDWSIDPFKSSTLVYVSVYIDVDNRRAFVDKLHAGDLVRSIDVESLISKCDEAYKTYFID